MSFILGFIYMLVTGSVLVNMAMLYLWGKREMCNRIYMSCQGMVALWCGSQILVMLARTKWELMAAYLIGNIGICFVGAFWYYFAVLYTGGNVAGIRRYLPITLAVCHYLLVLTNEWHHLYYTEFTLENVVHGRFFYTNVIVTYACVFFGAVTLYRHIGVEGNTGDDVSGQKVSNDTVKNNGSVAKILVVAAVLVPVAFNAIYLTGVVQPEFDITPMGFAISMFLVMLATVKYQFMDLTRELAITNERLLLEQERNRIAQQVHDTAGHTLTMIQSYMKLTEVSVKKQEMEKAEEYLAGAKTLTSQGIRELRESINQLRREASCELVTQGIMQLADQVREISVELTVQGEDSDKYSHLSKVIYDTVRESITNTLKYAECSKMEIIVRFQEDSVEMVIGDDGKGCDTIQENNGIRGIRERIENAGGTVRFLSSQGEGFLTRVRIPV